MASCWVQNDPEDAIKDLKSFGISDGILQSKALAKKPKQPSMPKTSKKNSIATPSGAMGNKRVRLG